MTRRRWIIGVVAVAVAGVAGWALWPRGPRLEWYTSPPKRTRIGTFRLQLLVPVGWKTSGWKHEGDYHPSMKFEAPHSKSKLPEFSKRILGIVDEDISAILVALDFGAYHENDHPGYDYGSEPPGVTVVVVQGGVNRAERVSESSIGLIQYDRSNRAVFDATYRQICESFRVIREK